MTEPMTAACQCEHVAHLERDARTPNGNTAHRYGQSFNVEVMVVRHTHYGPFRICPDCATDCLPVEVTRFESAMGKAVRP